MNDNIVYYDIRTKEIKIEQGEVAGTLTSEEAAQRDRQLLIDEFNAPIKQELSLNDIGIIRALVENDAGRIEEYKTKQKELRKTLKTLESLKGP